jgi:hypothetical protein
MIWDHHQYYECFENGRSPDECCNLMGDDNGKKMCLQHTRDGYGFGDDGDDRRDDGRY